MWNCCDMELLESKIEEVVCRIAGIVVEFVSVKGCRNWGPKNPAMGGRLVGRAVWILS